MYTSMVVVRGYYKPPKYSFNIKIHKTHNHSPYMVRLSVDSPLLEGLVKPSHLNPIIDLLSVLTDINALVLVV